MDLLPMNNSIEDNKLQTLISNNNISTEHNYFNEDDSDIYLFLGEFNSMIGNNTEAYDDLECAIKIFFNTISLDNDIYEPLIINYDLASSYALSNDYMKALKHIKICIKLIDEKNYPIDLTYLYDLLIKINKVIINRDFDSKLRKLHISFYNTDNNGLSYYYLNSILKIEKNNIDFLMLYVEELLILGDLNKAKIYLDRICKLSSNSKRVEYLYSKVDYLLGLKKVYNKVLSYKVIVKELISNNKYMDAIEICKKAFDDTADVYYLFYIGKIYIDNNIDYLTGLDMLKKCMNISDSYLRECYTYIMYYATKNNDVELFKIYSSLLYELYEYKNIDVDTFNNIILNYINNYNDNSVFEISKKLLEKNENLEKNKLLIY